MIPPKKLITPPGLAKESFTRIARNGIGDAYNSYPHSMAWFKDRLIVGTTRSNLCLFKISAIKKRLDRWPIECPDYVFDLDDNLLGEMMVFSKKVSKAIEKVIDCERVGVAVIGLEVPHAHIHLVPINGMNDMNFANPKLTLTADKLNDISFQINEAFNSLT